MNARKTAPLIGIVSLAAMLSGVTGAHALPEQVVVDSAPTAAEAQGARLSQYAAAYAAATKDVSFERTETIRSVKQAEAAGGAGTGTVHDDLSPMRGGR